MGNPQVFSLSNEFLEIDLAFKTCRLDRFTRVGWADPIAQPTSELFCVTVNGQRNTALDLAFIRGMFLPSEEGLVHFAAYFKGSGFEVDHNFIIYPGSGLVEVWPVVRNTSSKKIKITRVDSYSFDLPPAAYQLRSFKSDWGQEFEPDWRFLSAKTILETRLGRSSKGSHPWFELIRPEMVISGSVAWSGNWVCRFEPLPGGPWRISGGLNEWNFEKDLDPEARVDFPHCILACGQDLNDISQQYARAGRKYWYPHNSLSETLPVEWNHWWSYEDENIDEKTFLENVDAAAGLGIELCTLDAGWFGTGLAGSSWHAQRGDWSLVNPLRFPSGIRFLSDYVHSKGLRFGLWCEIEGLGREAHLNTEAPAFAAVRDGQPLGYVCLGNPAARQWAYQTLHALIQDYDVDWVKVDFNVDPLAGCSRIDHGHGSGDGLFEHILGLYALLDRLREDFPEVVLEACSSGGLRIDLGLARHTHLSFLSDQDWPVHSLQVFWGASTQLAPMVCLHWSFSEWQAADRPAQQNFNPRHPDLTRRQLDYYTRIAMLGAFGLSQKLPQLPAWVSERLGEHIYIYRQQVRIFVRQAVLWRLTGQPRRDGSGSGWCAFQYSQPKADQHLVFVFRLPGSLPCQTIQLIGLMPDRIYWIEGFEGNPFNLAQAMT